LRGGFSVVNNFGGLMLNQPVFIDEKSRAPKARIAGAGEQAVHKKTWAKRGSVIGCWQFLERTGSPQVIEKLPVRSRDNPRQLGKG
jgi:hypothetical protein